MQQALYHPEHGYYSSGRCAIGRKGDYFTNVSVGPLFGQLLASQFSEIWERLGKINDFVIVEQGAHDGQFALDVLEFAQNAPAGILRRVALPNTSSHFQFWKSSQRQRLEAFGDKVKWRRFAGTIHGRPFFQRTAGRNAGTLDQSRNGESLVGLEGDKFVFIERPRSITRFSIKLRSIGSTKSRRTCSEAM